MNFFARFPGRTLLVALVFAAACGGGPGDGPDVRFTVPAGASLTQVADTLAARELVGSPTLFKIFARFKKLDRSIKAGQYEVAMGAGWQSILDHLAAGRVVTVAMTVPEGFRLTQMAPRIARVSRVPRAEVEHLLSEADAEEWGVPGPTLEGYLFPDTYLFAPGVTPQRIISTMVARYQNFWTPERRARLDSIGMTEREVVTLASIIQAEARRFDEMPAISSVYHNRLREGWLLQADPTVLYALGGPRERLLYAAIDSVQDNPYNTYRQPGLPPGPIGAPGEAALDAALQPPKEPFYYFVARPDGSHVFTRTLDEHNRAKSAARREWDSIGEPPANVADTASATRDSGGSGQPSTR